MTNEKEPLEIKKKSQQVSEDELKNVAGGVRRVVCGNNQETDYVGCTKCS